MQERRHTRQQTERRGAAWFGGGAAWRQALTGCPFVRFPFFQEAGTESGISDPAPGIGS